VFLVREAVDNMLTKAVVDETMVEDDMVVDNALEDNMIV
jgi:hypothetical protein